MVAGLGLQALALGWLATEVSVTQSYASMIVPFILAGAGMALVFAPSASAVLNSVRTEEAGQASGATNAIRELGGTFGIAILATVFSGAGGYTSPQAFVDGLVPALWVGTGVLVAGALVATLMPAGRLGQVTEEAGEEAGQPAAGSRRVAPGRRPVELGSTVVAAGSKTAAEPRKRVPAAERRDALIEAAMGEFARGGLHGTKVSQVARAVGVAQPYVFTLFPTKVDLFLAAVERGFGG